MSGQYAFTKLFNNITASSVWGEPYPTRITWIALLAEADRNGDVFASVPGLARLANVSLGECEAALATFLAPDAYSRTKEHEGRRIAEIDGGWRLLNHEHYRNLRDTELRRDYQRTWAASKRTSAMASEPSASANVAPPPAPAPAPVRTAAVKLISLPEWLPVDAWNDYCAHRKSKRATMTEKAAEIQIKNLAKWREQGHDLRAIIERSIGNGWTGLFAPGTSPKERKSTEDANRATADKWANGEME